MAALMGGMSAPHRPVLLRQSVDFLHATHGGLFVDGTLGLGGHSEAILEASDEARVLGIDRDREALKLATNRLERFGSRFRAVHGDYREIARILDDAKESVVDGVVVDLGVSSLQFDSRERGFSFQYDSPLDMRMDASGSDESAAHLLATRSEEEIARILFEYGEERRSRRIAKWIVENRERGDPVETTKQLADLVARAIGRRRTDKTHPATRSFQAIRIAVNCELEGLGQFVETAVDLLKTDGRFVAISFHSLEDRIVKRTVRRLSGYCECSPRAPVCSCGARRVVEILTRRPIVPEEVEVIENPRSRSARMRACRKL